MTQALHLFITGRVQGVSYRANAARTAQTLGLSGWVRNLPDGRVELYAEGEEKPLKTLLAWAHEGPAHARIDHIDAQWSPASGAHTNFCIRD